MGKVYNSSNKPTLRNKPKCDINQLHIKEKQEQYKQRLDSLFSIDLNATTQQKWDTIVDTCNDVGCEVAGIKTYGKDKNFHDPSLNELKQCSHKLKLDIEATKTFSEKSVIRGKRKSIKKEIKQKIKEHEQEFFDNNIKELEQFKDDSVRYYKVLKTINSDNNKSPICVHDENNNYACSDSQKASIIANHFEALLAPSSASCSETKHYKSCQMSVPFTSNEVEKASKSLKNGKSSGIDNLNAELIKHAPPKVHQSIADILNETAKGDQDLKELTSGILTPLAKPGKKRGPSENLRPIILLSVIRKILTICLLRRCWDRFKHHIPSDQAAYQSGRSTTEQVFACKVLAEKAIISGKYDLHILLLDMSKAFDTVNRTKLFQILEEILLPEELHLFDILTNDVTLKVKVGKDFSRDFTTLRGIMQGDCLSAILFIIYLSSALNQKSPLENEHNYAKNNDHVQVAPNHDHTYASSPFLSKTGKEPFILSPKYADDITYIYQHQLVLYTT